MTDRGLLDLMIARLAKITCREKILLCESLGGESDFSQKSKPDIEAIIGRKLPGFWNTGALQKAAGNDAEVARRLGIKWVTWLGEDYPPLLREIYDPPALLFYRGSLPNPERPLAAIVGTRKPSPQSAAQAFDIAKDLGRGGIPVVSGLAIGIDAMAHRGNMEGGAPTYAVLGSGADAIYPSSNRQLAGRILETGGAIISEYPPGTGPFKWNFPARNRIISGLARGAVIVEAPQKSGALITARFSLEHNRDLWVASSGVVDSGRFDRAGTKKLAEEGAEVIHSASAIFSAWGMEYPAPLPVQEGEELAHMRDASSLAFSLGIEI